MKFSQFIVRWIWHTITLKYLSYRVGWPHKLRSNQSHTWKKWLGRFLLIRSSQHFEFMTVFMFLKARNSFLTVLLNCHVWMTLQIQVNFRYRRYSKVLIIVSYRFLQFHYYSYVWGQGIHCRHSYWATMFGWPRKSSGTGGSQRYWWVCIDFRKFQLFMFSRSGNSLLTFLQSYRFGWIRKCSLTSGSGGYSVILIITQMHKCSLMI